MKKNEFLESDSVKAFRYWLESKMDKSNSFNNMKYESLYSAYKAYWWKQKNFTESNNELSQFSLGLKKSIQENNFETCQENCLKILKWGGVNNKNGKWITERGDNICNYLKNVQNSLNSDMSSNEYYDGCMRINSGFSKIYSLCIENYIIYDSRVGAALGLLVREFCVETKREKVPEELAFAWGSKKGETYQTSLMNSRNPSSAKYKFNELNYKKPHLHLENNIRANWLLKEISNKTESGFKGISETLRMRAIEAALFMIGYEVRA